MYTVDASVWVNAFDRREPGHEISRRFLEVLQAEALPVVVPTLLGVEIAGAVSRTRGEPQRAQEFAAAVARLPNVTITPLDEDLAQQAQGLAAQHGLRGADAVYAAVALGADCTLVSLDREHLTRLGDVVPACTPAEALVTAEPGTEDESSPPEARSEAAAESQEAAGESATDRELEGETRVAPEVPPADE